MNGERLIVQVTTLAEFAQEVEPSDYQPVRLMRSNRVLAGSGLVYPLRLSLDLMGIGVGGEIVWLHEHTRVDMDHEGKPWTDNGRDVIGAQCDLIRIVSAWLETLGYLVRGGRFGLPETIEAAPGAFECARWDKETQTYVPHP